MLIEEDASPINDFNSSIKQNRPALRQDSSNRKKSFKKYNLALQ